MSRPPSAISRQSSIECQLMRLLPDDQVSKRPHWALEEGDAQRLGSGALSRV